MSELQRMPGLLSGECPVIQRLHSLEIVWITFGFRFLNRTTH